MDTWTDGPDVAKTLAPPAASMERPPHCRERRRRWGESRCSSVGINSRSGDLCPSEERSVSLQTWSQYANHTEHPRTPLSVFYSKSVDYGWSLTHVVDYVKDIRLAQMAQIIIRSSSTFLYFSLYELWGWEIHKCIHCHIIFEHFCSYYKSFFYRLQVHSFLQLFSCYTIETQTKKSTKGNAIRILKV
jgi:hypothetical protein